MDTLKCCRCKEFKNINCFFKNKSEKLGYCRYCKTCKSKVYREHTQQVSCECGKSVSKSYFEAHKNTNLHKNLIRA